MRLSHLLGAAAAVALAAAAAPALAVTITNGSFEFGPDPGSFTTLANGDTSITGWTVGPISIDYIGSYWQAADGTRSIDLAGNDKGSIYQTLTGLSVGTIYHVTFDLAGNPDGGGGVKTAVVSDGGAQASVFNFLQAGNTRSNMGWQHETFSFTATDSTAKLFFSATENNAFGPALDNVGISVPEPATWAMMLVGFGGIGAMIRSRRRQSLALAA